MVYGILAAAAVVVVFIVIQMNRSRKKEERRQYEQNLKDQALTESLRNSRGKKNGFSEDHEAWSMDQVIESERLIERNRRIVRLTVSGRKNSDYILSPEKHILIGKAPGMNEIVLDSENIARQQCDIFLYNDQVYIKNMVPTVPVILRRGSSQMTLANQAVRILTGDWIQIGGSKITVSIMDYIGNTIQG